MMLTGHKAAWPISPDYDVKNKDLTPIHLTPIHASLQGNVCQVVTHGGTMARYGLEPICGQFQVGSARYEIKN